MSEHPDLPCDCGHEKCEGVRQWVIDPYQQDLYGIHEWKYMCGGEHYEACQDI